MSKKIVKASELLSIRELNSDKIIVLCHGAFDILHPGHITHLEDAKKQGDILVVTITADDFITKKSKVFFSEEERAKQLAALEVVDFVCIIYHNTGLPAINALRPNIYSKGKEFKPLYNQEEGSVADEREALEGYGGKFYFTDTATKSSTKLAYFKGIMSMADEEEPFALEGIVPQFVDLSPTNYKLEQLQEFLEKVKELKVCIIGETIVDKWIEDEIVGASESYGCLSGRYCTEVSQFGGAGIVAEHVAQFTRYVDLYTNYGHPSIFQSINKAIKVIRLTPSNIAKTRFVDTKSKKVLYHHKKIESYLFDWDKQIPLEEYDVVIVPDFGHDLINETKAKWIADHSKWLAVQTQCNQDNYGHNLITKYPKANYINMSRVEAELITKTERENLSDLLGSFISSLGIINRSQNYNNISITDGSNGSILARANPSGAIQQPSLASSIVDSTGCGDAFFALSSLVLGCGLSSDLAILSGNIGATIMAHRMGNDSPVTKKDFSTVFKIVT